MMPEICLNVTWRVKWRGFIIECNKTGQGLVTTYTGEGCMGIHHTSLFTFVYISNSL